ncbi:MAG: HEAT repeat domain-containing protein [Synechococcales bacterium]|nr:HEAT repeat domain-containing protein [Synechococcales bacterium]
MLESNLNRLSPQLVERSLEVASPTQAANLDAPGMIELQQAADTLDLPRLVWLIQTQLLTHEVAAASPVPKRSSHAAPVSPRLSPAECDRYLDWLWLALEAGDFQIRWDVAKLIPSLGTEVVLPTLLSHLQAEETEPELRWFLVRILGNWADPAVMAALLSLLQTSPEEEIRGMAATALASLGKPVVQTLAPLLQDPAQRLLATQMLAQIRNRDTLPLLLTVVNDSDRQVRSIALEAVSSFQSKVVTATLAQALQDPSAAVRTIAARGLGFCRDLSPAQHLEPLVARLWDVDMAVCLQVTITLGRLGWVEAVKPLGQVLQSPVIPDRLGKEVVQSLVWINDATALAALFQALQSDRLSPTVTQTLLRGLSQVETQPLQEQVTQFLLGYLPQAAAPDQAIIVSVLGQLGNGRAIAPLQALLPTATDSLRWHLLAALKRLSATPPDLSSSLSALNESGSRN